MLSNNLFVNASAAKRILGLPASRKIEFRYVGDRTVIVWEKTLGEVSLDREEFEQHFVEFRRQGAKECIATPHRKTQDAEIFQVTGTNGTPYYVECNSEAIACTCEDWQVHESICKHGWAVLSLLGLSDFEGYVQARSKIVPFVPEYHRPAEMLRGISID
jgi:SWIM zinc finger